jgi:putative transposase
MMLKAFKYRLNPTDEQIVLLNKHIGASRFIYNLALETKQIAYAGNKVNLSYFELHAQLKELKEECEWLKELNSQSLQQAITNLDKAYTAFFKGQNDFPKFKKKSNGGSFNIPQNVRIIDGKLIIPKFTKKNGINIILHRELKGEIRQATISKTPTGKYFVSILCDTGEQNKPKSKIKEETTIGLDLGIKDFAITSNGEVFENPKYLRKVQDKLKYVQSKYSKNKGKRTKHKLVKLHEKVVNKRKDYLHKVSTKLVRENQTICLENLVVSNMIKNHNLAQSISDVSWSTFVTMLEYKAEWYGTNILRIGRFEPSSKTCSNCGNINKELTLKDREWKCVKCKTNHDRDINAAINIKNFSLRNILSGTDSKNHDELPTLVGVMTHEAHPIASGVGG